MPVKPVKNASREEKLLQRLLDILNHPAKKQQLPSLSNKSDAKDNNAHPDSGASGGTNVYQSAEAVALEQFSSNFQSVRKFSAHKLSSYFTQILDTLVKQRLSCSEWIDRAPRQSVLRVFTCLRILLRDQSYQQLFFELGGMKILAKRLEILTEDYLEDAEGQGAVDLLREMTNICQKLTADDEKREWLIACGVHKPLVMLLYSTDIVVLHCSLHALIGLSQSEKPKIAIGDLNSVEVLLHIIENYDVASKKLATNLLRILCSDINTKEQVKVYEGIRICLSLLDSDNVKLLWNLVWIIVQLSEDADSSDEVRVLGGIPLLLSLIHKDRVYQSDQNILVMSSEGGAKDSSDVEGDNIEEILSLKSAACTALTELVLNDTNGQQIVQANGIYLLSSLILSPKTTGKSLLSEQANGVENLQKSALRALRFLFSMERNRQLFKILFPPDIFETFIDVGHYVRDLNAYKSLVDKINNLSEDQISVIRSNIEATNKRRAPTRMVGSYDVLELLGSGAFGSVYKVRKKDGDGTCCAMKEILLSNPNLGKTMKERNKSVGNIIQETKIMKEKLSHPNVVKYFKAFQQKDKLYVIMEFIEGAPLGEHFNSLKEKKDKFSEERIWNIFVQMVLGLRYLHKEKHIVHRDLTPNNVMLGGNDKVTITDFGLARQKLPDASELTSVVGTILYSCPEILQHLPYDEKADVWAAGCLLYQMATLKPPFYSSNMLQLATKIVEADYEPIPGELYSHKLPETVGRCITSDPKKRPDIVEVGSIISEIMMKYTDKLRVNEINLQRKLERERKRTQKHFHEANRNMQNYHRLFWANQERLDRMSNLSSSAGAYSLRAGGGSDGSDGAFDAAETYKDSLQKEKRQHIDAGSVDALSRGISPTTECNSSGNDVSSGNSMSKSGDSPGKIVHSTSSTGAGSESGPLVSVPHPPNRSETQRRQLLLDISSINKTKSPLPSILSPTDIVTPNPIDPLKRRSQSSSSLEMLRRQTAGQAKARPPSAAATLSISPRKVRQINDPISQILHQLHKILFITQLPPTLTRNPHRRTVEKFKRALFTPQTSSVNLKSEIKKVLEGSKDIIDLSFGFGHPSYLTLQSTGSCQVVPIQAAIIEGDTNGAGITYEQMQAVIESVLMESGYYDVSPNIKQRRAPLGPIVGLNGK